MKYTKLAFVIGSLGSGGAEKVCASLSNFFVENNIDVTIYIKNNGEKCIYQLDKRITVKEIEFPRAHKNKIKLLRSGFLYIYSLKKQLKKDSPDIIVSFSTGLNILTIPIARCLHKPIIVSEHSNHLFTNEFKFARRCVYKYADIVTVLTQYDYQYYTNFLKNVMVMHNPIILHDNESQHPTTQKENFVLGAGTMTSYITKGFDRLIGLFPYQSGWKLRLAGRGDHSVLTKICSDKCVEDKVEFLGEVKNIDLLYDKASIFALSSRTEGLPMVLLEAMSHGCACVSFDIISGPSEIIDDGVNGFLVKDGDIETFRDRLTQLMGDQQLRIAFGKAAIEKSKSFSIDNIGAKWLTIIESTLGNHINSESNNK